MKIRIKKKTTQHKEGPTRHCKLKPKPLLFQTLSSLISLSFSLTDDSSKNPNSLHFHFWVNVIFS